MKNTQKWKRIIEKKWNWGINQEYKEVVKRRLKNGLKKSEDAATHQY